MHQFPLGQTCSWLLWYFIMITREKEQHYCCHLRQGRDLKILTRLVQAGLRIMLCFWRNDVLPYLLYRGVMRIYKYLVIKCSSTCLLNSPRVCCRRCLLGCLVDIMLSAKRQLLSVQRSFLHFVFVYAHFPFSDYKTVGY